MNDPQWLAKQTYWRCGKAGHIHPKCTVSQAKREVYYTKKMAEQNTANVTADKPVVYMKAMLTEDTADKPEVCADVMIAEAIVNGMGGYTAVIDEVLVKPQAHMEVQSPSPGSSIQDVVPTSVQTGLNSSSTPHTPHLTKSALGTLGSPHLWVRALYP